MIAVADTKAALKAVDTSAFSAAALTQEGKENIFFRREYSTMSAQVTAANDLGLILRSTHDVSKVWAVPLHKEIIITELDGVDPTNASFSDAGFAAALEISRLRRYIPIYFPPGHYKFAGSYTGLGPVPIVGSDQSSAGGQRGVRIDHHANTDFIVLNGGTVPNGGTGGRLERVWIDKAPGFAGGRAVSLIAQNDSLRPGEFEFNDVIITGNGGEWNDGILIDGRNCNTPGARGVRSVSFNTVRITGIGNHYKHVHFRQATHVKGQIVTEPAGGTGAAGITFDDYCENVDLHVRDCSIYIPATMTGPGRLTIYGKVNDIGINPVGVVGRVYALHTGGLTNNSPSFVLI